MARPARPNDRTPFRKEKIKKRMPRFIGMKFRIFKPAKLMKKKTETKNNGEGSIMRRV
jgi:hypothetical protein